RSFRVQRNIHRECPPEPAGVPARRGRARALPPLHLTHPYPKVACLAAHRTHDGDGLRLCHADVYVVPASSYGGTVGGTVTTVTRCPQTRLDLILSQSE